MINYTDAETVFRAAVALSEEMAASGRERPRWMADFDVIMAQKMVAAALMGMPPARIARNIRDTWFYVGILAEREGWPLVGDVAVGTQQEGEAS